ncbi:stage II sporulation protein M [Paenibacillus chartarius]|uniref:Stage II sporulation protein M n=1 Tax=Paenibacillus chartarius TaxID=747481 RepID=A0ABV6DLJ2_9BACL
MRLVYRIIKENRIILLAGLSMWVFVLAATFLSILLQGPPEQGNNLPPVHLPWSQIFMHNAGLAILYIILGNLTFGSLAFLLMLYNIYIVSYAIYYTYMHTGSIGFSIAIIFTHGILEIAAMLLCFLLSTTSLRWAMNKIYKKTIFSINSVETKAGLVVCMMLLYLVASVIESYLSPIVPAKFLGLEIVQ